MRPGLRSILRVRPDKHDLRWYKRQREGYTKNFRMPRQRRKTTGRRKRRTTRSQKGGVLPLLALIAPALAAAGKTAALGAVSGAAGYGIKKAISAAERNRRRGARY